MAMGRTGRYTRVVTAANGARTRRRTEVTILRVIEKSGRGTGRTTRAIKAAPQGAHYVVAHASIVPYVRDMARRLGRSDLKVIPKSTPLLGVRANRVVFDHYQGENEVA